MNLIDSNNKTIRTIILTITVSMLAWYLFQSFDYAVNRYYNADELRYGHAAWLVAKGYRPYVDFWDAKFPFIYQFMSFIFTFTDDHPGNILYLRIIMFMMLCITSISVYKINNKSNDVWAIMAPIMLLSVWSYIFMAIEIQPDGMATALYFASIAILYVTGLSAAVRGFLAGILFTLCLWTSQKAFCYGVIFPTAFIIDIIINFKTKKGYILGNPLFFLLGSLIVLMIVFCYLISTDTLIACYQNCIKEMFFSKKSILPYRPKHLTYNRLVHDAWALFPFIYVGLRQSIKEIHSLGKDRWHNQEFLTLFSFPFCFLVWYLQKGPYLYSMLPLMASMSIFAGRGISTFFSSVVRIKANYNYKLVAYVVLPVVLFSCHMLPSLGRSKFTDIPDNKYQHHIFNLLSVLTDTSDPVYDNSGSYVSRPHAYYIYFTSILMRKKWMRDQLIREVPDSIRKTKCTVFIKDYRTRTLPENLRSWLENHFLPYNKDIYIWGRKYKTGDSGIVDSRFEAVRTARYFVSPADVFNNGQIFLNGKEIKKQIFIIEKGNNSIFFKGKKNIEFRLLWLPRNNRPFEASFPVKNKNGPFSYILY